MLELSGTVSDLHRREVVAELGREAWFMQPSIPALVLGSAQRAELALMSELESRGLDLATRRSGGGAVLVDDSMLWIDLVIGRDDPLWVDDIGVAFEWVGQLWKATFAALSVPEVVVHRGALEVGEWGRQICFCSLGPGEVRSRGRKVVGISQRRTRDGARFQCSVLLENSQSLIPDLLAIESDRREDALREIDESAAGLSISAEVLRSALRAQLGG